jgi:hypothetical protein
MAFDPAGAVRFDLPSGTVRTADEGRVVVVPVEALAEIARSAPQAIGPVGQAIGAAMGKRLARRLRDVQGASIDDFAAQLCGEVAVSGLGVASIERWGRAMVIALDNASLDDALLAAILGAAIYEATGRALACMPLGREGGVLRLLITSDAAVARARAWMSEGVAWGEVLSRLQSRGGDA